MSAFSSSRSAQLTPTDKPRLVVRVTPVDGFYQGKFTRTIQRLMRSRGALVPHRRNEPYVWRFSEYNECCVFVEAWAGQEVPMRHPSTDSIIRCLVSIRTITHMHGGPPTQVAGLITDVGRWSGWRSHVDNIPVVIRLESIAGRSVWRGEAMRL